MKFTIRHKLLFGFAVVLAALVGVGTMNLLQINQLEQTIRLTQGKEAFLGRAQSALWAPSRHCGRCAMAFRSSWC